MEGYPLNPERDDLPSIPALAAELGVQPDELESYGRAKAKLDLSLLERLSPAPNGKLVLVTAVSPTPAGEGKTTFSIGLTGALRNLGCAAIGALRQPSMGPVFGRKGGGAGGGRAQLIPGEEINLHFTGDFHAITAANNLLAAVIDNHLHWGEPPDLDPAAISWKRCLDVNDRGLRRIRTAVGPGDSIPQETGFEITAASEMMAILSLAESYTDLSARLERIVVGADRAGNPVKAGNLGVTGAMAALLRDALKPNLVRTLDGAPALVHGGPFGNIAHGCSSVLATRMALKLGDVCITEAGFGADLGAEKFIHIKAGQSGLYPDAGVLVATARALKMHGGAALEDLDEENVSALEAGFVNLARHAENLQRFGLTPVVAINRFDSDTDLELRRLVELCSQIGLRAAVADVWNHGGAGAEDVARLVLSALEEPATVRPLYAPELPLREKIETLARDFYGAGGVEFLPAAVQGLARLQETGFGRLPVCMAKTQYSFSDNPELRGAPTGHTLTIREVKLSAGAGFVVAYAGKILTMPGLPRHPGGERIRLEADGSITGVR